MTGGSWDVTGASPQEFKNQELEDLGLLPWPGSPDLQAYVEATMRVALAYSEASHVRITITHKDGSETGYTQGTESVIEREKVSYLDVHGILAAPEAGDVASPASLGCDFTGVYHTGEPQR